MADEKKPAEKPAKKPAPKPSPGDELLDLIQLHVSTGKTVMFQPTSGRKHEMVIVVSTPGSVKTKTIEQTRRRKIDVREDQQVLKPALTDAGAFQTFTGEDGKLYPLMEPVWAKDPKTNALILDEEGYPQGAVKSVVVGREWEEETVKVQIAEIGNSKDKTTTVATSGKVNAVQRTIADALTAL